MRVVKLSASLTPDAIRLIDAYRSAHAIKSRSQVIEQALPTQTGLLTRYQTTLDNDLYKALKALREAQAWRQARAALEASAVPAT